MATKPAFKIDSKGNLSVSGDFTFFKGDYTNAPTEEKLKDNLRTYLGIKDSGNIAQVNYLPVLTINNDHAYTNYSYDASTGTYTLTAAQDCSSKFSQYYSYDIPCRDLAGEQCRLHVDSITTSKSSLTPRLYVQFYNNSGASVGSQYLDKNTTTKTFYVPEDTMSLCYILRIDQNRGQTAGDTATFTKPKLEIDIGYDTPWYRSPLDWGRFESGIGYIEKSLTLEKPRTNDGYLRIINQWTVDKTIPAQVQLDISVDKMGIWSKSEDGTTSWPIQTPLATQDWTFTGTKAYNSSLFTVQAPTVKLDCTTVQLKSTGADIALKWGSSTGNMVLYNSGNIIMNGYIVQKNNRGNLEFRKPNGETIGLFETISTAGEHKGLRIRSYSDASNYMPYVFIHDGQLDTRSVRCITISSSPPSSPKKGDIWIQPET